MLAWQETSNKSANLDERGIFAVVCRHCHVFFSAIMPFGERYAFNCLMLYLLVAMGKEVNVNWCVPNGLSTIQPQGRSSRPQRTPWSAPAPQCSPSAAV